MLSQLYKMMGLAKNWPEYTLEEVKQHNTPASLWIVAGSSVYDVTSLLGKHVGGDSALLKRGGGAKDCTQDFLFHGRGARREAEDYKIGELIPSRPGAAIRRAPQDGSSSPLPAPAVRAPQEAAKEDVKPAIVSECASPQTTVSLSPSLSTENMAAPVWHTSNSACKTCGTSSSSANGLSSAESPIGSHSCSSIHELTEVTPSW